MKFELYAEERENEDGSSRIFGACGATSNGEDCAFLSP